MITAAAAAGVALALTTGGTPAPNPYGKDRTSIVTAAWTVSRDANGLVTFTLGRAFDDPAGLEQALKSEGVTIIVKLNPVRDPKSSGGVETPPWYACAYTNLPEEPQSVLDAVARPLGPIETSDNDQGWIIDPAAMPAGSALFFQGAQLGTPGSDSLMYNALVLLTGDDPGPCVPQTGPVPGYPGVWPYVAPPTPTPGPVSSPTPVSSLTP